MAKILILDDTKTNLSAAAEQLKGHALTLVEKFSEARALLSPRWDSERKEMVPGEHFDVVLTDLFLPGEKEGQGPDGYAFIGESLPVGLVLALLAIKVNVAKVAIVSNGNHHANPVTWALDALQSRGSGGQFSAEVNTVIPGKLYSFTGYECPTVAGRPEFEKMPYEEREPFYDIKDWARVLDEITKA